MSIDETIDQIEELIGNSWSLPFSGGRSVVDDARLHALVEEIRANLPEELAQSRGIVNERNQIISDAKQEADAIVRRAEERARTLIAQEEIVKQAQKKATETVALAQKKAKELREGSLELADDALRQSSELMVKMAAELRSARQAIHTSGKQRSAPPQE